MTARPQPGCLVIFGATGDLTRRKLFPALYNLFVDGLIDPATAVVGFARRDLSDDEFRRRMREAVEQHSRRDLEPEAWERFAARLSYCRGDFNEPEGYRRLASHLAEAGACCGAEGRHVFYLATPPSLYEVILSHLGETKLSTAAPGGCSRVIVEKPFGRDRASARELNETVGRWFQEDQIYRIDHYLGKETVQNILVLRLGNGIFEPLWNQRYVDHVQITVAESLGIEGRADYFDRAGTLRDIFQNHMMQLLCLVAMEPPVRFEAGAVRDEKVKVLRALELPEPAPGAPAQVRGVYAAGAVGGKPVPGYREEPDVPGDSETETFLAARVHVENWRWAGVPFLLRSGKRLPKRVTEIALVFRRPPQHFFGKWGCSDGKAEPNTLALRIQPDEGISLFIGSKTPGQEMHVQRVEMEFLYSEAFGGEPPTAYEHLLLDCFEGDSTLFARRDEVELAWGVADRLRERWSSGTPVPLHPYEAGTWGPAEADELPGPGRGWRDLGDDT